MANRLLGTLVVHAVAAALLAALLYYLTLDARTLIKSDILDAIGDPEASRAQLAGALRNAGLVGVAISLACAIAWLFICERNPPSGNTGAAAQRGSWVALLFAALAITGVMLWLLIWNSVPLMRDMIAGNATSTALATIAAVAAAYYLSTAAFARRSMRPSVPGASSLFNR